MTRPELTREGGDGAPATPRRIAQELRRLRPQGPSAFAILSFAADRYYQVAGGGGGMMLEKREGECHWRAHQDIPVVPFEDGTELSFGGSRIPLLRDEWFTRAQAIELLTLVASGRPEPRWVRWRDVTEVLGRGKPATVR